MSGPSSPSRSSHDGPVLITGGAGFIGCNIADRLASEGREVLIYDALARPGVSANLDWLRLRHGSKVSAIIADIRDETALAGAVRDASVVFHMAAQVAVTTSLGAPLDDFEVNARGTLGLLEALRRRRAQVPLIFASTNKVYGDLADVPLGATAEGYRPQDAVLARSGIGEDRPLAFHTPYGCSKGAADQYVLDYARSFDLPTCVLRMSCIYGPRQMGTEDQGWVAHFLIKALKDETITIYGDGRQVRDVLDVSDAIDAYIAAWHRIDAVHGQAFNLGGGPVNAVSLQMVLGEIERILDRPIRTSFADWRTGDQRYYVSDTSRVSAALDLPPPRAWRQGLAGLAGWLKATMSVEPESQPRSHLSEVAS